MSFTGGNISDTWKRWKQRWSLYKLASGASTKDEAIQCAIFLHVVGSEGIDIYNTFTFADGETDKITPLMEKFDAYCTPKKNITYERYIFNTRGQQAGETVDQYVTELKNMATTCEYGELRESLIRDRIVIKCSIRKSGLEFLGHWIDARGVPAGQLLLPGGVRPEWMPSA